MKRIYRNMMKPVSTQMARTFLDNELSFISRVLAGIEENITVVVVGCSRRMYADVVHARGLDYIGIDPYASGSDTSCILPMTFEQYALQRRHLHPEKCLFVFWFNVLSHIDITSAGQCFVPGDIIINSVWGTNAPDTQARDKYYASFDDGSALYQDIFEKAKKSSTLLDMNISFQSVMFYSESPNYFEIARV